MLKKVLILSVMLTLLSVNFIHAQDDPLADIDPTGAVVEYWHEWEGDQLVGLEEAVRLFEESNDFGITVDLVFLGTGDAITERLAAGIVSGELPNVAGNGYLNNAEDLFLEDVLESLGMYFDHPVYGLTEEEMAAINLDVIEINRPKESPFDGDLLALPTGMSAEMMYVNLDMVAELSEAGELSFADRAPETLEEFRELACASTLLSDPNGDPVRGFPVRTSPFSMYPFIFGQGGYLFDTEAGMYDFTNDGLIEALEFVRGLMNDECAYIFDTGFTSNIFGAGQVPMANGSNAGLPFIVGAIEESGSGLENWVMTTYPWDAERVLQPYLRGVTLINQTPEENLASWLFVKFWLTNTDALVAWTEGAGYAPYYGPVRDALSEEWSAARPQFGQVLDIIVGGDTTLYALPSHPRSNEIFDITGDFFVNAITTDDDIMALAEEATEEANDVYAEVLEDLADASN